MTRSLSSLLELGATPNDSQNVRLQKRTLITTSLLGLAIGFGWGAIYLILGEPLAASIPGLYGVFTALNLVVFVRTKHFRVFRDTQLLSFLILPFLLQLALGGFVGASAVIVFALYAPLGALAMVGRSSAIKWMIAFGVLLTASLILQPSMTINNGLGQTTVGFLFLGNILGLSLFVFVVLMYSTGQRDQIEAELQVEREKSDDLLLNILPAEVAADLKDKGETEARYYESASVLFADMVSFTEFAQRSDPGELVGKLNELFSQFDEIARHHQIEKIRTIGDAYMATAGVPVEWSEHAQAIARAALDMRDYVDTVSDIEFRIGISSGPLVAGVIGTSKFQFDVWGDTVNVASRMESSGEAGQIQISDSTRQLLDGGFQYVPRGTVEVKGKGQMTTWFLVGYDQQSGSG